MQVMASLRTRSLACALQRPRPCVVLRAGRICTTSVVATYGLPPVAPPATPNPPGPSPTPPQQAPLPSPGPPPAGMPTPTPPATPPPSTGQPPLPNPGGPQPGPGGATPAPASGPANTSDAFATGQLIVRPSAPQLSTAMLLASLPLAVLGLVLAVDQASAAGLDNDTVTTAAGVVAGLHAGNGHMPLMDISEEPDFLSNVARYGRYFVTVLLGTGYVMLKPLRAAFDKPATAFFAIAGVVVGVVVVKFTLEAMLGIGDNGSVGGDVTDFQQLTY